MGKGIPISKAQRQAILAYLDRRDAERLRFQFLKEHRALEKAAESARQLETKPAPFVPFRGGSR